MPGHDKGREAAVIGAIALGGMLGASARHAVGIALPTEEGFPTGTYLVNVSGCLLIGVLMVVILETGAPHPLARPFLGVGLLGGYTTFSTYAVEADTLLRDGRPLLAAVYLAGTLVAALVAVQVGVIATRAAVSPRPRTDSGSTSGGLS